MTHVLFIRATIRVSFKNQLRNGVLHCNFDQVLVNYNWLTDTKWSVSNAVTWHGTAWRWSIPCGCMIGWVSLTMTEILFYNSCAQLIHLFKLLKMVCEHTMCYITLWARHSWLNDWLAWMCALRMHVCFYCLTISAIILRSLAAESSNIRKKCWTHWIFSLADVPSNSKW